MEPEHTLKRKNKLICNFDIIFFLYSGISSSRTGALKGIDHSAQPVLENVRDVANGVSMGEKVPSSSTVAVVVQPGAEDEVCSD